MPGRSALWLIWGLALLGTSLDQGSKYAVFAVLKPCFGNRPHLGADREGCAPLTGDCRDKHDARVSLHPQPLTHRTDHDG